jgi:hypothetical protein
MPRPGPPYQPRPDEEYDDDPDAPQPEDLVAGDDDDESETVPCPHCGAQISALAERCPACGDWVIPGSRQGLAGRSVLVVAVLLALVLLWLYWRL